MKLLQYQGVDRMLVISRDGSLSEQLLSENKNVGFIHENHLIILPEGVEILLSESEQHDLNELDDFDIFEINSNGLIHILYRHAEGDAGIATTSICNSNCKMCPASEDERRRDSFKLEKLLSFIRLFPENLTHFTITGGEPTLIGHDNFIAVIKEVASHFQNTKVLLLTNGRTFGNKAFFDQVVDCKPNAFRIAIPIHGSAAEKHDDITQSEGSFVQTIRGISNILNAGIELELRVVVSKLNIHDLNDIAEMIIRHFPRTAVVNFIGLEMRGNCILNQDEVILSYEEAFQGAKKAIRMLIMNGIDVGLYNFPYCMIEKGYWPIAKKSISAYKVRFAEACELCVLKKMCCGFFTTSMYFLKPVVKPILAEELLI